MRRSGGGALASNLRMTAAAAAAALASAAVAYQCASPCAAAPPCAAAAASAVAVADTSAAAETDGGWHHHRPGQDAPEPLKMSELVWRCASVGADDDGTGSLSEALDSPDPRADLCALLRRCVDSTLDGCERLGQLDPRQLRTLALATCVVPLEELEVAMRRQQQQAAAGSAEGVAGGAPLVGLLHRHWHEIRGAFPAARAVRLCSEEEELDERRERLSLALETILVRVVRCTAATRGQRATLGGQLCRLLHSLEGHGDADGDGDGDLGSTLMRQRWGSVAHDLISFAARPSVVAGDGAEVTLSLAEVSMLQQLLERASSAHADDDARPQRAELSTDLSAGAEPQPEPEPTESDVATSPTRDRDGQATAATATTTVTPAASTALEQEIRGHRAIAAGRREMSMLLSAGAMPTPPEVFSPVSVRAAVRGSMAAGHGQWRSLDKLSTSGGLASSRIENPLGAPTAATLASALRSADGAEALRTILLHALDTLAAFAQRMSPPGDAPRMRGELEELSERVRTLVHRGQLSTLSHGDDDGDDDEVQSLAELLIEVERLDCDVNATAGAAVIRAMVASLEVAVASPAKASALGTSRSHHSSVDHICDE